MQETLKKSMIGCAQELLPLLKEMMNPSQFLEILSKDVVYEIIENIRPENHDLLKADLEKRLGFEILRFEIGNINFLKDVAKVTVYYKQ